jgi:hypothetical protein
MKSMLNTLDILLGHLAAGIMTFLLYLSLGAVAIFSLIGIPFFFFEETAGISELDVMELGLLIMLVGVIWRFYRRGSQLYWTWWQMIRRFVFAISSVILLFTLVVHLAMLIELTEKGRLEIEFINRYEEFESFMLALCINLAIYAATPLPKLWQKKESSDGLSKTTQDNADESSPPHVTTESQQAMQTPQPSFTASIPEEKEQTDISIAPIGGKA